VVRVLQFRGYITVVVSKQDLKAETKITLFFIVYSAIFNDVF
jgi:hypothetical protein